MARALLLASAMTCSFGASAANVYKCVEGGKTVFQGVPCRGDGAAITVAPANGTVIAEPAAPAASASAAAGASDSVSRMKDHVKSMEADRKKREHEYTLNQISLATREPEAAINNEQSAMNAELAALRGKKLAANNSLAGATWEQSISSEMQAITQKYAPDADAPGPHHGAACASGGPAAKRSQYEVIDPVS
jgi:uncharacterized protein DUF4124